MKRLDERKQRKGRGKREKITKKEKKAVYAETCSVGAYGCMQMVS